MAQVCFDAALLKRYGGRGPRYTSYPAAPQFHPGLTQSGYERHARHSNTPAAPAPLSLYVHLPFCESLCYYCGCNKVVTRNQTRAAEYLEAILQEASLHGQLYDRQRPVTQLHLGGGTPTFYDDEQLAALLTGLQEHFSFADRKIMECSVEVDPRTVGPERIARLAELGFNRLSLGVQDFDQDVQEAVNRLQSRAATEALVHAARAHGYRSVSFDLIYGLPRQSRARFERTLDSVIELRPDRVSLYSYAHLPHLFRAQTLIDIEQLPDGAEKLALLECSIERLCSAGYEYIGMDHFALADDELVKAREEGRLHRNFQGYSTRAECDLVSLGASAIGKVGDCFYQNEKNTNAYARQVRNGLLPIVKGYELDEDDRLRSAVIQALMCQGRLDQQAIGDAFGIDFDSYFAEELLELKPLERDGLVSLSPQTIAVTARGQLLLRPIAMIFDRYLRAAAAPTRYSKVI